MAKVVRVGPGGIVRVYDDPDLPAIPTTLQPTKIFITPGRTMLFRTPSRTTVFRTPGK